MADTKDLQNKVQASQVVSGRSHTIVGIWNDVSSLESSLAISLMIKHTVTTWPRNSTPRYTGKKRKHTFSRFHIPSAPVSGGSFPKFPGNSSLLPVCVSLLDSAWHQAASTLTLASSYSLYFLWFLERSLVYTSDNSQRWQAGQIPLLSKWPWEPCLTLQASASWPLIKLWALQTL